MMLLKELLDKIKWDKSEDPEQYSVFYLDRIAKKLVELKYKEIKRIEDSFMVIVRDNEETFIPLHRVKEVRRQGKLVWRR